MLHCGTIPRIQADTYQYKYTHKQKSILPLHTCIQACTHTHKLSHMCVYPDVLFLHQEEPCQKLVSTSWCASDGAGCDVGFAALFSQDAAGSHTMGLLNYPVRHLNRQTGIAGQLASHPESQSATRGHDTLCIHLYVKAANGLTANRGPWKPHVTTTARAKLGLFGLSSVFHCNREEQVENRKKELVVSAVDLGLHTIKNHYCPNFKIYNINFKSYNISHINMCILLLP